METEFIVFGMSNCRYCSMTVALLKESGKSYTYHNVMDDVNQRKVLLEKVPMANTLPQIFHNGVPIGGYTELVSTISP